MHPSSERQDCFWQRLATADSLVRSGAWASGHAIARSLLDCAGHAGCEYRGECAAAAGAVIGDVRRHVANDAA